MKQKRQKEPKSNRKATFFCGRIAGGRSDAFCLSIGWIGKNFFSFFAQRC